jgi:hypothetical protein
MVTFLVIAEVVVPLNLGWLGSTSGESMRWMQHRKADKYASSEGDCQL